MNRVRYRGRKKGKRWLPVTPDLSPPWIGHFITVGYGDLEIKYKLKLGHDITSDTFYRFGAPHR